jgi:hypothetical protein
VAYLRLHGRNAAKWFVEGEGAAARYDYRYPAAELELELRHRLRRAPLAVPPSLLTAYPELCAIAAPAQEPDA